MFHSGAMDFLQSGCGLRDRKPKTPVLLHPSVEVMQVRGIYLFSTWAWDVFGYEHEARERKAHVFVQALRNTLTWQNVSKEHCHRMRCNKGMSKQSSS